MIKNTNRNISIFVMAVLLLFVITSAMPSIRVRSLIVTESIIGDPLSPIKEVFYIATLKVSDFFGKIAAMWNAVNRYEEMRIKYAELEHKVIDMNELKSENERLRNLLNFVERKDNLVVTGGNVIGKDPGLWFDVFTINVGNSSGVTNQMAVINHDGLLGLIMESGSNWAKVRSIIDSHSAVGAIIERTRYNGVIRGNSLDLSSEQCRMYYLPLDADIVVGDRVLTSGLDGIFPKGILIGEVKEILEPEAELYATVIIEPAADFKRLEEVLVITHEGMENDS